MNAPNDFASHGLTALSLLGQNPSAGRATWLAKDSQGNRVVVKRFSFASPGASWEAFREHERELAVLRELEHPAIPRFVTAFHSDDAFCIVQEFIDARPLSQRVSFAPGEVERIARKILEVLVYLQARTPPVVHRDLKPDNVLLGDDGRLYLVDFGLARSVQDSTSTIAVGTPGFMPPEQMLGHRLGRAADLYALGATLIACLSGARGHAVREYVDSTFRFDLSRLPVRLEPRLERFIARLVEPDLKLRFPDARAALEALDAPSLAARSSPAAQAPLPLSSGSPDDDAAPARSSGRPVVALAALVLVVATAGVAFLTLKSVDVPSEPARGPVPSEPVVSTFETTRSAEAPPAPEPPAPFPSHCSETMILENRDFVLEEGRAPLRATRGCVLTLRGVKVTASSTVLDLQNGAKVELENVTFEVKRGPALRVSDRDTTLAAKAATLRVDEGAALDADREARVSLTDGILRGPRAIEARRRAQVTVSGGQVDGELVEDGGYVLGLDEDKDAAKRKQIRAADYAAGACSGVANCFSQTGYRGRIDVDVIARTRDGSIDATRVVPAASAGVVLSKEALACIDAAMKARPIENYQDDELGFRVCSLGGEIMGGTQMLSQGYHFFFESDSKERAAQMKRLFR